MKDLKKERFEKRKIRRVIKRGTETTDTGEGCGSKDVVGRRYFLDMLRVAATCAVVLMHTLTGAVDAVDISQYPAERLVYLVVMDLITWCVPIFVLISGYLFLNPDRHIPFMQMLQKYCRRIVLALFLFGVPYALLELVAVEKSVRFSMIGQSFLMVIKGQSWSHMWYLYLILALYLITPALKWLLARIPRACIYGILLVLLTGSSILPFLNKLLGSSLPVLPDGGIYFFYYICGYLFVSRENRKKQDAGDAEKERTEETAEGTGKERGKITVSGAKKSRAHNAVPGVIIALFAGMALSRIVGGFSLQMAYNYPFTVLVSLLLFQAAMEGNVRLGEKAQKRWQEASGICFAVYLIHPVFVNVLYKFLHVSLFDFPIGFSLLVFFLVILLLAAAAAWILCRIPGLKRYVL